RVARVAAFPAVLVGAPHVQDRQLRIVEPPAQLLERRYGLEAGLELVATLVQLHHSFLELARPGGKAARHHRHCRVARELGELSRRGSLDVLAAVVEDETLLARDAVAAQAKPDLRSEAGEDLAVGDRSRRAEHER